MYRNLEDARRCFQTGKKYQLPDEEVELYNCDDDLASVHLLMKNYESYVDLRREILQKHSMNMGYWLTLAMGLYLVNHIHST